MTIEAARPRQDHEELDTAAANNGHHGNELAEVIDINTGVAEIDTEIRYPSEEERKADYQARMDRVVSALGSSADLAALPVGDLDAIDPGFTQRLYADRAAKGQDGRSLRGWMITELPKPNGNKPE